MATCRYNVPVVSPGKTKKWKNNKTKQNKYKCDCYNRQYARGAGLNPELMEQDRQLGPEPSDADTPLPRRRRGATANAQEESTEGVESWSPLPCMCVQAWQGMCNASMCQTCMSSCTIDTSSWAATASCFPTSGSGESPSKPWGTRTTRCTL